MFKLDMTSIRQNAIESRLMANLANLANTEFAANLGKTEISRLANLAISQPETSYQELCSDSAYTLMKELINSAMRCCDQHEDGDLARAKMDQDCQATPPHLQVDLLDYFNKTYGVKK